MPADVTASRVGAAGARSTGSRRRASATWLLAAAAVLLGLDVAGVRAEPYRIGTSDRVRVTVVDRPTLSGEFTIGPAGVLKIPSLGGIAALGVTSGDLEQAVAEKLKLRSDQAQQWVSVEVVAFGPIYVTGAVNAPGSYPFEGGMTVAHAIAVAGGLLSLERADGDSRLDLLRAHERVREVGSALGFALARQARLRAELAQASEITLPEEVSLYLGARERERAARKENQVLLEAFEAMEAEKRALARSTAVIEEQIEALRGQYAAKSEERRFLEEDIKAFDAAGSPVSQLNVRALRRLAAEVEGEQLELLSELAGAKERIERAKQDVERVRYRRRLEVAEDQTAAEAGVAELRIRLEEARERLSELRAAAASPASVEVDRGLRVSIIRNLPAGASELEAMELTPVQPRDLIKISIGPPAR